MSPLPAFPLTADSPSPAYRPLHAHLPAATTRAGRRSNQTGSHHWANDVPDILQEDCVIEKDATKKWPRVALAGRSPPRALSGTWDDAGRVQARGARG